MSHTDYRTLVDHGRKAGLRTNELYQALSSRPPQVGDPRQNESDGNGYVSRLNAEGRPVLQPRPK
jgi:hypothetical protein